MNAGIIDIIDILWLTLTGNIGGINFIQQFSALGLLIFGFLVFKSLVGESVNLVTGRGTELPKTLIKYLFVTMLIAGWPWLADSLYLGVVNIVKAFFPDMQEVLSTMLSSWETIQQMEEARKVDRGLFSKLLEVASNPNYAAGMLVLDGLLIAVSWLILILCYAIILINAVGAITILVMNLVLGPVFIALSFDKDFRSPAVQWMMTILSYTMLMPLYGAAIRMAAAIAGAASFVGLEQFTLSGINVSSGVMAARLLGPFLAVGIVFSTNKVIASLIGGTGGSGLGGMIAGVAATLATKGMSAKSGGAISGSISRSSNSSSQAVRAATGRR